MNLIKTTLHKIINLIPLRLRIAIKNLPVLASLQRNIVNRFMKDDHFIYKINAGPARGFFFNITLPEDKNIWTGTYELEFSTALSKEIVNGSVCYDIGGFKGYMSGLMAVNGASEVYTFEPLKENYDKIKELANLNPSLNISVFEYAIGSINGEVNFDVSDDPSMNKIENSQFQNETGVKGKRKVKIFTLDNLVLENGLKKPSLIKIDVEGAELDVISGAEKILKQFKPKLFIEVHGYEIGKKLIPALNKYDYSVYCLESKKYPDFISETPISHYICR